MIERNNRKCRVGIVINDKNDKTRKVSIKRVFRHPLYGKIICENKKFTVHDEYNVSHMGDIVKIMESRSFSRTKKWILIRVLK
ncbi:MAG: 30S ribosomal protein S17 [Endomicrobium sp.]|jgi:small subunit ribosomal protein S17|nr:30S ribosomal protein S17 [Endomicrobium sp.]